MRLQELLAIAIFLGDEMSEEQAQRLSDESRELSIADQETLMESLFGGSLYTALSMRDGEMGGFSRY